MPTPFAQLLPMGTDPLAIDLLERMLVFDPQDRISVDDALSHEYFADIAPAMPVEAPPANFSADFEGFADASGVIPRRALEDMMYAEILEVSSTA